MQQGNTTFGVQKCDKFIPCQACHGFFKAFVLFLSQIDTKHGFSKALFLFQSYIKVMVCIHVPNMVTITNVKNTTTQKSTSENAAEHNDKTPTHVVTKEH